MNECGKGGGEGMKGEGIEVREEETIGLGNGTHPYLSNCAIPGRHGIGT